MAQGGPSGVFSVVLPTLGVLLFLAAIIAFITGFALLFPGPIWAEFWSLNPEAYRSFHRLGTTAEAVLFALGIVAAVTATGLLRRERWSWGIALLLFAVNGAGDFISLLRTEELLRFGSGVLIAAGFIALLLLPPVRRSLS